MAENHIISFENQKILPVELEREMRISYVNYAMSVIVGRALPDVRDGLKPVHRRILYCMYEEGLTNDKPFRKSATAVGDVLGRYHPHGDASVYDALVRMAQDFSLRYLLVDGHGNFGSIDGDPPAAYRYTEARMSKIAAEMMADIEKDTVDFEPNFDNRRLEPKVLPSRFPNLLVNGSTGIAVGMATNVPPHNLREIIDATVCLLDDPDADIFDLMQFVKGPDFPTYGTILGTAGIRAAYATGKGRCKVRAKCNIEEMTGNRQRIVVTEIPYMVNKTRLVESMADLVKDKTIEGISALRDESDRNGMKIVIDLKRDANAQVVLNKLYAHTQLQNTFAINMLALVDQEPKILSLKEMLSYYIAHQKEVVVRRTRFDLRKARERAHIVEGLRIAAQNIDEVVRIIRASHTEAEARVALQERFALSELQSAAIVDMRLGRLTGLQLERLENEWNELMAKISDLEDILASDARVIDIVRGELQEVREKFGDDRRTAIEADDDEIDIEDLIEREDCVYTLTHLGYIKRQPKTTYRAQRRGGRGVNAMATREEDFVEELFVSSTHDEVLFFTNRGRLHRKKGYFIPEAGRAAKGTHLANLLPLESGEKVTAVIPVRENEPMSYLVMVTRNGTVKRMERGRLDSNRKAGVRAIHLEEGDELVSARKTDGTQEIIIATHQGAAICFNEADIRLMGRDAGGVRGIRLREGDFVVAAARARQGGTLLTVTEKGYGKRTDIEEYKRGGDGEKRAQSRGGYGVKNGTLSDRTGLVASVKVVDAEDDVLLISDDGTIIRMAATDINVYSRGAQGVRLMRIPEGSRVISLARTDKEEEEPDESVLASAVGDEVGEAAETTETTATEVSEQTNPSDV